jgi:hypothetical protein
MELSSNVINTLKILSNDESDSLSNDEYSEFIRLVFDSFIVNSGKMLNNKSLLMLKLDKVTLQKLNKNSIEKNELLYALYTLLSELAKNDTDSNLVITFLEDLGFANDRIKTFLQFYEVKNIKFFFN